MRWWQRLLRQRRMEEQLEKGAVILVLLIACVNLTNLLLARGAARQGEPAMRAAPVTLLFGVSRLDQPTYIGVMVLLAGTSLIACSVPAWRAARVDPSIARIGPFR
jgi:ABC-type lipoprotein release transport system permease subunit